MQGDEFVKRMGEGDPKVLSELAVQIHSATIRACYINKIHNIEDREDIEQEVALKVHQKWAQYANKQGNLDGWIKSIANNRCIDFIRSREVRHARDHESMHPQDDHEKSALDTIPYATQSVADVKLAKKSAWEALKTIKPTRQNAKSIYEIMLWITENGTQTKSLADFLGTSESAAKERVSALRKKLRPHFKKFCGDECGAFE